MSQATASSSTAAAARTLSKLVWSATAEGLVQTRAAASLEDALAAVRAAVVEACHARGLQFSEATWRTLVAEVLDSARNELLAQRYRETTWVPSVKAAATHEHSSLWDALLDHPEATSQEVQLAWEVCASFDGHLTHPCAKTKLGLRPKSLLRMAPEFEPCVPLVVAALARSCARECLMAECLAAVGSCGGYFAAHFPGVHRVWASWLRGAGAAADDFVPLPLHPANLAHVKRDFAELLAARLLLLPVGAGGAAMVGAPLMSCRTLLPLCGGGGGSRATACASGPGGPGGAEEGGAEHGRQRSPPPPPYVKLPVPVQMTSLRRYLSPVEASGGPVISAALARILRADAALAAHLHVLPEECAVHVEHPRVPYERARYLSCLYRANVGSVARTLPAGALCVLPFAALLSLDPLSGRPVLWHALGAAKSCEPAAAAAWYRRYCGVLLGAALRLW